VNTATRASPAGIGRCRSSGSGSLYVVASAVILGRLPRRGWVRMLVASACLGRAPWSSTFRESCHPRRFVPSAAVQHERTALTHSIVDVRHIVGGGDAIRYELDPFEGVEVESVVE
jgi:hypothetical protein